MVSITVILFIGAFSRVLANKELECVGKHITVGDMCILFVGFIEVGIT